MPDTTSILPNSGYLGSAAGNLLGTGGSNTSTAANSTWQYGQFQPYSVNNPLGQTSFGNNGATASMSPLQSQLSGLFGNQIGNNLSGPSSTYNPNTTFLPQQYQSIFGNMQGNVSSMFNSLQAAQQPWVQQNLQSNLDNEQAKGTLASTAGAYQTAGAQTAANSQMNSNMAQAQNYALQNAQAQFGAANATGQLGEQQAQFAPQFAQNQTQGLYGNLLNYGSQLNQQASLGLSGGALQSNANTNALQNNFQASQQQDQAQSGLLNGLLTGNGTGGLLNSLFGTSGGTSGGTGGLLGGLGSSAGNFLNSLFGGSSSNAGLTNSSGALNYINSSGGTNDSNYYNPNGSLQTITPAGTDIGSGAGVGNSTGASGLNDLMNLVDTSTGQSFNSAGGQATNPLDLTTQETTALYGSSGNPFSSSSISSGLSNAGSAFSIAQGLSSGTPVGEASGALQAASLANRNGLLGPSTATNAGLLGAAGSGLGIYSGIEQGGVAGYGNAAVSGLRAGSSIANLAGDSSLAGGLSSAAGYLAAPLSLYNFANNWQSGATGSDALNGAEAGASIGSIVPGIGTAIGAVIGGAVGAISSAFGGGKQDPETQMTYGANAAGGTSLQGQSPGTSFQYLAGVLDAKNNTAGHSTALEQAFGRGGEGQVLNGMASQIDSAISSGKISNSSSPSQVFNSVVLPWLNSKGVSSSSLTFTDAKGNNSGSNLQEALTNLVGSYMNGSLTSSTKIGVSGQTDSTLQAFV